MGDHYAVSNPLYSGVILGNYQIAPSQQYTISPTPFAIVAISNTASKINYEIRNSANARFGTLSFTRTGSAIVYDDSYVETAAGVSANMSANADSILVSVSSGTATFKFNFQTFV
jgi:hypothetical protein